MSSLYALLVIVYAYNSVSSTHIDGLTLDGCKTAADQVHHTVRSNNPAYPVVTQCILLAPKDNPPQAQ